MTCLAEENLFHYHRSLCDTSMGRIYETDDCTLCMTGFPMFNTAFLPRRTVSDLQRLVSGMSETAAQHGVRTSWLVRDNPERDAVESELLRQEFTACGAWQGMFCLLSEAAPATQHGQAVITQVQDDTGFAEWLDVVNAAADAPESGSRAFNALFTSLAWHSTSRWVPYILRIQGVAASACMLYRHHSAAGVYWVATRPEHRRRGYAGAVVSHALCRAAALGYRVAVLYSAPQAVGLYRRIGFRECGDIHLFRQPRKQSVE
jgi:GNAT superfamily N-acetyltransferase